MNVVSEKVERVYTVLDWYDGPRSGVADLGGDPQYFESEWLELDGNYADTFRLSPIDDYLLAIALEAWGIWERWRKAFNEGAVDATTHPTLPEDKARHEELEEILVERLKIDPNNCVRATAEFELDEERKEPFQQPFSLLVQWKIIEDNPKDSF